MDEVLVVVIVTDINCNCERQVMDEVLALSDDKSGISISALQNKALAFRRAGEGERFPLERRRQGEPDGGGILVERGREGGQEERERKAQPAA